MIENESVKSSNGMDKLLWYVDYKLHLFTNMNIKKSWAAIGTKPLQTFAGVRRNFIFIFDEGYIIMISVQALSRYISLYHANRAFKKSCW